MPRHLKPWLSTLPSTYRSSITSWWKKRPRTKNPTYLICWTSRSITKPWMNSTYLIPFTWRSTSLLTRSQRSSSWTWLPVTCFSSTKWRPKSSSPKMSAVCFWRSWPTPMIKISRLSSSSWVFSQEKCWKYCSPVSLISCRRSIERPSLKTSSWYKTFSLRSRQPPSWKAVPFTSKASPSISLFNRARISRPIKGRGAELKKPTNSSLFKSPKNHSPKPRNNRSTTICRNCAALSNKSRKACRGL